MKITAHLLKRLPQTSQLGKKKDFSSSQNDQVPQPKSFPLEVIVQLWPFSTVDAGLNVPVAAAVITSTVMAILSGGQWTDCVQGILFSSLSSKRIVCAFGFWIQNGLLLPPCFSAWGCELQEGPLVFTVQNVKMAIPWDSIGGCWLLSDRIIEELKLKSF